METEAFSTELVRLGERLRQIRKLRKLKLLDLEILSGINDSDISRYERGKENIEFITIFRLAAALQVDLKMLFDYDGHLPDNSNFKGILKVKSKSRKR